MTNPQCPKCGRIMKTKTLKTVVGVDGEGRAKFWVCPNKSKLHGTVKFRKGAQVIM